MITEAANVNTPSTVYLNLVTSWDKATALLGGTQAMQDAGTTYLPQHEAETDARYNERLCSNVLFNMFKATLATWVGKPFSRNLRYSDDFDPAVRKLCEDIDLRGNDLFVYCKDWFKDALAYKMSYTLVEFPRIEKEGRTLADDARENVRPYFVHISPQNVIYASKERVDGREVFTSVRIREEYRHTQGWEEVTETRIRVLERTQGPDGARIVSVTLFAERVVSKDVASGEEKREWQKVEEFFMDIDEIPLVEFDLGEFPLGDLADLNIRHWQSMSDQVNVLTVARFPILAASGVSIEEGDKIKVGPKKLLTSENIQGKFYYVEHNGAAISAGRDDLTDLETRMKSYGAEYMKQRPSRETATGRLTDEAAATSPLQDAVSRFNDTLVTAMYYVGKWLGKPVAGKVLVPTDFTGISNADVQSLDMARTRKDLSRRTYLTILNNAGYLGTEFNYEKNESDLLAEQAAAQAEEDRKNKQMIDLEKAKASATDAKPNPAGGAIPPK